MADRWTMDKQGWTDRPCLHTGGESTLYRDSVALEFDDDGDLHVHADVEGDAPHTDFYVPRADLLAFLRAGGLDVRERLAAPPETPAAERHAMIDVIQAAQTLDAYVDFNESNLDGDGNWTSGPPDDPAPMDRAWLALGAALRRYAGSSLPASPASAPRETPARDDEYARAQADLGEILRRDFECIYSEEAETMDEHERALARRFVDSIAGIARDAAKRLATLRAPSSSSTASPTPDTERR